MTRIFIASIEKCSQMSNPLQGIGSGGDRCTFAVIAMLLKTFKQGIGANPKLSAENIMYSLTEQYNNGSDISQPMSDWWDAYFTAHPDISIRMTPIEDTPTAVLQALIRGHVVFCGLNNYARQRTWDNGDPYAWVETPGHPEGHVELLVGIDDFYQGRDTYIVQDPLRGVNAMPWDYLINSVHDAGCHFYEVIAPPLPIEATF